MDPNPLEPGHPLTLTESDEIAQGWEQVSSPSSAPSGGFYAPNKQGKSPSSSSPSLSSIDKNTQSLERARSLSLQYFSADEPELAIRPALLEKQDTRTPSPVRAISSSPAPALEPTAPTQVTPIPDDIQEPLSLPEIEQDSPLIEEGRERRDENMRSLFSEEGLPVLKERALSGDFQNSSTRGIGWRVFLGVLSPDPSNWIEETKKHRENFVKIRAKHTIDPHAATSDSELDKFNPLSQHAENPWNQYFKNADMRKEITHDVLRTYPGIPFFDTQETKDLMTELLFLYAKENSSTRYIQGMNELLAPLLYIINEEKVKCTESASPFDFVKDEQYMEHDGYTLFSHLLHIVGRWFSPLRSGNSPALPRKNPLMSSMDDKLYSTSQADESTNLQIVQECRHIHYNLLNEVDPQLARYLKDLQIEPHLYMLRWVRIMLCQVFPLPAVLILWDGIFAFGNNVALLDWLCVAMLVSIRHLLLGQDYSACMSLLFNYPSDQDIPLLVATAQRLSQKYQTQRTISPKPQDKAFAKPNPSPPSATKIVRPKSQAPATPASVPAPAPAPTQARSASPISPSTRQPSVPQFAPAMVPEQQPKLQNTSSQSLKSIFKMFSDDKNDKNDDDLAEVNGEVQFLKQELNLSRQETANLRGMAEHMSNRLERVIYILGSLPSTPESEDMIRSAIDEVNEVSAVLHIASGQHPDHKPEIPPGPISSPPAEKAMSPPPSENGNGQPRPASPMGKLFSVFRK